ncbi:unnamed protein product [Blepharisma stoltei]|uniref:Tetratricopeptide repeat protein n=1 Tax=Blepharisma stoltei TaxID=1481888 RepID=A0AAU9K4N0_9CILI|nr:unnamed protein product [Blepharisma stoltei]
MWTKFVSKKLLYTPLEYFLINPHELAEQYTKGFNLLEFKDSPLRYMFDFILDNYSKYCSKSTYGLYWSINNNLSMLGFIIEALQTFLKHHQYGPAYELLDNLKEFSFYIKLSKSGINNDIDIMQCFLVYLSQNLDFDMELWNQAENNVKSNGIHMWQFLFFNFFQTIFQIANCRKYFVKCSKFLINLTKLNNSGLQYLHKIYKEIAFGESNLEKRIKYYTKAYHTLVKNINLVLSNNRSNFIDIYLILTDMIEAYETNYETAKSKIVFNKFKHLLKKKFPPKSTEEFCWFLFCFGKIFYLKNDYKSALEYLERSLKEMKKRKYVENYLFCSINYYLGLAFFKEGNYELAIKKIYSSKRILEAQLPKESEFAIKLNRALGRIYMSRHWCDEALKYFKLIKESGEYNDYRIDYWIGEIYYKKGEIDRPLNIFENYLSLLLESDHESASKANEIILLYNYIANLYNRLGNYEKFKWYTEKCFNLVDHCFGNSILSLETLPGIIELSLAEENYERCEDICLKSLKFFSNILDENGKFHIHIFLLRAYELKENYEMADKEVDYLQLNIGNFSNKKYYISQILGLISIATVFRNRSNYIKAEASLIDAKQIHERNLKTWLWLKIGVYVEIGVLYKAMGRLEESELYFLNVLDIYSSTFYDTKAILNAYAGLADINRMKNDISKQKYYLLKFIELYKEKNCNHHPLYYIVLVLLIKICKEDKDDVKGIACWLDLKEYFDKTYPGRSVECAEIFDENKNLTGRINLDKY